MKTPLIACVLGVALASCASVQHFPSSETVGVVWQGKTAIQPYPGLECAIDSALDVIATDYPTVPALRKWVVMVYGPNDFFDQGACTNVEMKSDGPHLITGCTDQSCSNQFGFSCTKLVLIRQITSLKRYPTGNPNMPEYSGGELYDAGSQGQSNDQQGRGVIFWEIADRLIPQVLFENHLKASDGTEPISSHGSGTDGDPLAPVNVRTRNKMIFRYYQRGCGTKTSTKTG